MLYHFAFFLKKMKIATICITLIPFVHSASALDPNKAITQYVHDRWNADNGLRDTSINCILQTRDRYLWFGTFDGIVRYDGFRFTFFNKRNTPILTSNVIVTLLEGRDGTLWIGTWEGGLYSVKNGIWKRLTTRDGLANDTIFALEEDTNGTQWIGTVGGGLHSLKDGKMKHYSLSSGLLNENILDLHNDAQGNLWIATRGGLNLLKDGKLTSFTTKDGLSSDSIKSLFEDDQGTLWIGTIEGGLNRFQNGRFTSYSTKEGLSHPNVHSLLADRDGNLWIGTPGGLNRFKNGRITSFSTKEGLTDDSVESLYEDVEGNLWVGTAGGLNRFRDSKFTNFTLAEGLSSGTVWSVFEDRSGAVWIGTAAGLNRFVNGKFSSFTRSDGLSSNAISVIQDDPAEGLWVGTDDGGLNHFMNGKFTTYTTKDGLLSNNSFVLFKDRSGDLWIGSAEGLNQFRNGSFRSYTTKDGLPNPRVRAITQDLEGNLWIGTYGGLSRFKNGQFKNFTQRDGLATDVIISLYTDRDGTVWIGTLQGLSRFKQGQFKNFTARDGLSYETIGSITDDDAGNLWICGGNIFSVSKSELDQFAEGKIKRVQSIEYGKLDGIKIGGCKGLQQPTSWKAKDGKLWFAGDRGALAVDLRMNRTNPLTPNVVIEEILADHQPIWSNSIQPDNSARQVKIPPGKERFQFRYTASSLTIPERVQFRFMLEGFDRNWIDAGTQRYVEYTNLRPGNYQFRVKAGNENGVWNERATVASVYLEPRFHQTLWFYGLCLIAGIAAVFTGYKLRVQQLKEREKELVAAVEKGTKDLRDANQKLQEAEQRILQMAESGPQALENLPVWSRIVAEDIARVIGAEEISVWKVENQAVIPLVPGKSNPPSLEMIQKASSDPSKGNEEVLPVKGLSGDLYGALVVRDSSRDSRGQPEKNLLAGFAHQLGGALEMDRMRKRLAEAERRRAGTIQDLQNQGVAILGVCPACDRCYDRNEQTCEMDGAMLETTRILPYRIVDRYRLTRFLGEGGMGLVFQAEDEKLRRHVAIKIIHQERINNPILRIRLKREAQVLAQIRDPGTIDVYDFGELPDGSAFIVMEFLTGHDLAEILRRDGPGTPQQVATVLLQIGKALDATHSKGVIHRDLKPSNLFIVHTSHGFQTKILDFGLAKPVSEDVSLTSTGMVVGTPSYMSPEQARNQLLGEESDLFSLAVLTYELLTDVRPFYGDSTIEVVSKILAENPPPISTRLKNAPPELDTLIFSALAKNPEERPRSILNWTRQVATLLQQIPGEVHGWLLPV